MRHIIHGTAILASMAIGAATLGCADSAEQSRIREALDLIKERRGVVGYDQRSPDHPVISVDLNEQRISDDDLKCLAAFPHLREVNLSRTRITDAGMRYLSGLQDLRVLGLSDTDISDAGLAVLEPLQGLQGLGLGGTKITDQGVEHLKGLTHLQVVYLTNTHVSAAGAKALQDALPHTRVVH